jgi:mercuric reductase
MTTNEITFSIGGMTCNHCATTLRAALSHLPRVHRANVSFEDQLATLHIDESFAPATVVEAAAARGYAAKEHARPESSRRGVRSPSDAFDLVVLGSGGAAFGAALRASELGAKVAVVERGTLGGTCVNIGCVPSKTLIRAAEGVHRASHARFAGIASEARVTDFKALMRQKQSLVEELRQAKYADVLAGAKGVSFVEGHARFDRPGVVSVAQSSLPGDSSSRQVCDPTSPTSLVSPTRAT